MLIHTNEELRAFIARARKSAYAAIDTEFLREKTYWAKLCLVQVCTEEETAIIDPLSLSNFADFGELLDDDSVLKIFHACSQDIEILFNQTGVVPHPIFDTQVAASLIGKTQQASYASLVSSYCKIDLPKKDSYTDWSRRPLSESQLSYAADDVIYLPKIYARMMELLKKKGREHWLDETFRELENPDHYKVDPYERYKKLKRSNQLNPRQLAAAREFAAWREERAQKANIPRKWVVSDEQIVEACRREPHSLDDLYMVRGLRESLRPRDARVVLDRIKRGLSLPAEELPQINSQQRSEANVDVEVSLMNAMVSKRARQHDIAVHTLAPHAELMKLARGHDDECELLKGWRLNLIGAELRDLRDGKFSLAIKDGNLKILRH